MKVHIQKSTSPKIYNWTTFRGETNKVTWTSPRPVGPSWDLRCRVWEALASTPVRDSGFFLASCWWYHMISSYSETSRIYSGDISSNGNGVYVRKTTLYALPHFCKSFFRPCSTTTWTTSLVFTRRKTDEAINFNPSIWTRTRSPQINYVQPYFPTFK